jgi:hypothetical protein
MNKIRKPNFNDNPIEDVAQDRLERAVKGEADIARNK